MGNPEVIDGVKYQKIITTDEFGNPSNSGKINGYQSGTLFGDNVVTTKRNTRVSGRWSQGLPLQNTDISVTGTGYWKLVDAPELNGACEIGTGTDADAKVFISTKRLNRYQDGHASYFTYTGLFGGIANANGDFTILIGAMLRGLDSDGQYDEIKEGHCWGYKKVGETLTRIFRIYKNFTVVSEYEIPDESFIFDNDNLTIYTQIFGYLGIHPPVLYGVKNGQLNQFFTKELTQATTHVNDPNLALGLYVENQGNTTNIYFRNGSINFGNLTERIELNDSSGRRLIDDFTIASISTGTTNIALYTLPEKSNMIKSVTGASLTTTLQEFRITQTNLLLNVQASGTVNKVCRFNIYLIPKSDITGAVFSDLNANFNVLQRLTDFTGVTISKANATLIKSFQFLSGVIIDKNVREENFLLDSGLVALLEVVVPTGTTLTDFEYVLDTIDLF